MPARMAFSVRTGNPLGKGSQCLLSDGPLPHLQLAKLAWKRLLNNKVATVAAVVAGLAAFLGNIDVIEKFFGWGQPEPIKIVLSVLGSEADDAPGSYVLHLKYAKTGSDSARDCRVEAWRGSFSAPGAASSKLDLHVNCKNAASEGISYTLSGH
jgi:hypothetical protein